MPALPTLPKLRLWPEGIVIPVSRLTRLFYVLSALAALLSAGLFFTQGLNYGIDFRGGALVEAAAPEVVDLAPLRQQLAAALPGDVQVQHFGNPREVLIRAEGAEGGGATDTNPALAVADEIRALLEPEMQVRRVEVVGPKVSRELVQTGFISVIAAIFLVLLYIWVRFEWQFSLGAVLALVHDVILTIGVFSLMRIEFNLSIVAAILTIVGYSLNDTVVVYDRVRENLRKYRRLPLPALLDISVAQTLSRSLMTSVTTLLALLSLYFFGGAVIEGFAFAMIWGVIVGTYSSIFIAAPLLMVLGVRRDWGEGNR